jgi:hypothetical protein
MLGMEGKWWWWLRSVRGTVNMNIWSHDISFFGKLNLPRDKIKNGNVIVVKCNSAGATAPPTSLTKITRKSVPSKASKPKPK